MQNCDFILWRSHNFFRILKGFSSFMIRSHNFQSFLINQITNFRTVENIVLRIDSIFTGQNNGLSVFANQSKTEA